MTKYTWWAMLPALVVLGSCQSNSNDSSSDARISFLDLSGMDTTISPGDDFFRYANGKWLKETDIPASETGWGSFYLLQDENTTKLHGILIEAAKERYKDKSDEQKVGDFYASGMDTLTIEKLGITPIKSQIEKIDALKNVQELIAFCAGGFKEGHGDLFHFYIASDDRISTKNALTFIQGGLNLPDAGYYLENDEKSKKIRSAYRDYIVQLFTLNGEGVLAKESADQIIQLETTIAKSHLSPVELRDPIKNYNKYSIAEFQTKTINLNWKDILEKLLVTTDTILVQQPKYYMALDHMLISESLDIWKKKLKLDVLNGAASALSKDFRRARFDFYGRTLNGQQSQKERWKLMVNAVDDNLGELLGKLYAEKYFKAEAKERMMVLVDNLQKTYKLRIGQLDWMTPETKKKAVEKLEAFTKKIGYPDKWKNYDDVVIGRDTYYANLQSASRHAYKEMVNKMGKPVDKAEWLMTPPTVNAYYNPPYNEIVFPAGILQFPFFDFNADDAINYGAIGAVIGHEMTHGFDDQGRQYDKEGNLSDWWTAVDARQFNLKAKKVVDLYDGFTLLDNQHVNGELTLGENLADIGGLSIAYDAFKLTTQGKANDRIDGFTPDQRFFLSFAQVWRIKTRDETMLLRLKTDPHSPEEFRVNGPLYNMESFYQAFNIQPSAKKYIAPVNRVGVW